MRTRERYVRRRGDRATCAATLTLRDIGVGLSVTVTLSVAMRDIAYLLSLFPIFHFSHATPVIVPTRQPMRVYIYAHLSADMSHR